MFFVALLPCLLVGVRVMAATVATYAGSGVSGMADGPAASASFMMPNGIAWDSQGKLYVTDTTAQRLRVVLPNGEVRTVAGSGEIPPGGLWVAGGYADGRADAAKFNYPNGIAVGLHDEVYVADTYNHCIRVVTADGDVSTFAGNPQRAGAANGPRGRATFNLPLAVAVDQDGNLYVADPGSGLRKITPGGIVSSMRVPMLAPFGVSVSPTVGAQQLFVTNSVGLWIIGLTGFGRPGDALQVSRFFAGPLRTSYTPKELHGRIGLRAAEGQRSIGNPFQVAALDLTGVVYSDYRTHTVRYLNTNSQDTYVIGGQAIEAAANEGGGFSDGPSAESRFDSPAGVAARRDGLIAVADAGNKRIRLITGIDRGEPLSPTDRFLPAVPFTDDDYRIAYIGNSYVWADVHSADSIGGQIERRLRDDGALAAIRKNPRVLTVRLGSTFEPLKEYVDALAATQAVDLIVVQVNSFFAYDSYNVAFGPQNLIREAPSVAARMRDDLLRIKQSANAAHIPLLFVAQPLGFEISLTETRYETVTFTEADSVGGGALQRVLTEPFAAAGVPWLNLWQVFTADEASPAHKPLFLSIDGHATPYGNHVTAQAIAAKLEEMKPWNRRR